jgi:predicted amidohydrolase
MSDMPSKNRIVKAAAVQAELMWFDLQATVDKTCKLIKEAATNGADIVAFPDVFVLGYPTWVW